jgi:TonB-linked SusC/RagA family outer membrane protein
MKKNVQYPGGTTVRAGWVQKKCKGVFLLLIAMLSWSMFVSAQQPVTGKVASGDSALAGVSVSVKGTSLSTMTDGSGAFTINAPADGKLLISSVGYEPQEVSVGGRKVIPINLITSAKDLTDVVVVGYGTQRKVNVTGAVSTISAKDIDARPITQASQALAGLTSGVTVSQGSGRPGNDGASIVIRGLGTFSGAGNGPLILVDGLASSINDVDPNNIKSISVLKDAASASIYGTRAANGVILIETKRGQTGKMQIGYNNYMGWQKATQLPDFVESGEYAELRNEANVNAGQAATYSADDIANYKSGSDPDNFPNVPHLKNLLNSGSGFQTNHNINFSGGDAKTAYLFSLGYLHQEGLVAKNDYSKYNFLVNIDSRLRDNLKLKVDLLGNTSTTNEPRQSDGDMTSIIRFAVRQGPIFAGRKSDGTYGYQDSYSPEGWLASNSFIKRKNKFFQGGMELSWEVVRGLTLSQKVGVVYSNYVNNNFLATFTFDQFKTVGPNSLEVTSGDNSLLTLLSTAVYDKSFGDHQFKLLGGFQQESFREDWSRAFRDNFPNNSLYELNAAASSNQQSSGSASEWGLRSFFGRLNYSFQGKYLFEANARYDGTSRFPGAGRWGLFPSVSAGWRISEESFIRDNIFWIDNMKLRASWGRLGNQNVGTYPYQNILSLGQNYSFGGTLYPGARLTTLANSDITWETTAITDIGLDVDAFRGKFGFSFDYFDKRTSDILYNVSVSQVLGLGTAERNAGSMRNTGFDLTLKYNTTIGKARFGFSPNFSYVKNSVTKLGNNLKSDIGRNLFVGQPFGVIYGYEADGLFVNAEDVTKYPAQPYSAQPGFVRYKDLSGPNGVPDGKVDATYDRKVIGTTFPKYSYGATINASVHNFDLFVVLHGLAGFQRQMGSYQAFAFYNAGQVQRWQADNRWTVDNPDPNAQYIKLTSLNQGSGTIQTSTFWNRDASFVRVKNLQIGYTVPARLLQQFKMNQLRFFASAQNLFSVSSFYQGWDPEMSQNSGDNSPFYPITAVYTFGLSLKF